MIIVLIWKYFGYVFFSFFLPRRDTKDTLRRHEGYRVKERHDIFSKYVMSERMTSCNKFQLFNFLLLLHFE